MKNYNSEAEGRIDFYKELGYQGNPNEENCNVDYSTNTDGVINGVLFEHKPVINSAAAPLNRVLGQAIKYLSKKRINGIDVPDTIILISKNDEVAYHFRSENYFKEIHEFYYSSASNDNDFSVDVSGMETIKYGKVGFDRIKELIETSDYIKVDVDVNNVIALARRFYSENKTANKNDFLNEIRQPNFFKYINSYTKEIDDNSEFGYIMDKLNDDMLQQEIGAYYTPVEYSEKSLELLRKAIIQVPAGNDYVIIDRCAGTGNLEEKMTDEELKHCILNTYEYFEWLELRRQYEDRVRYVVPKSAATYVRGEGVIKEGDALTEDFFKDSNIRQYINNPKVSVIVFENPPYFSGTNNQAAIVVNAASGEGGKKRSTKSVENNWIIERMIDEGYTKASIANTVRQFIWSAYKDYLRQNGDSLVVYSPASYFNWYDIQSKTKHLKFDTGFGFNRKHFHASDALVTCIKWDYDSSYDSVASEQKEFPLQLFEINKQRQVVKYIDKENIVIKKSFTSPSQYFVCKDSTNAFACLVNNGSAPKTGLASLYSIADATKRGNESYLNKDNYYNMLPVYIAQLTFDRNKWYNNDNTLRTFDRKYDYTTCNELLKRSLIFTCLYRNNHMVTKKQGSHLIVNQLCFDSNTVALNKLNSLTLDESDKKLIKRWESLLSIAKQTANYKANYKYGVYQIMQELDTFQEVQKGLTIEKKYDNPDLHNNIIRLNKDVKKYYDELIEPLLFEYELIK